MFRGAAIAVVGPIIVLATLGIALGALAGECDLFNPVTSAAQARSTDAQTQIDTVEAQMELEQHEAEITAQQAADKLDLEHQAAIYEQIEERGELELQHYRTTLAIEQESLQRQYELQVQNQQQAFERKMAILDIQRLVLLGVGSGAIISITVAVAYYLYACGRVKLAQMPQAERDRWVREIRAKQQHGRQHDSIASRQSTPTVNKKPTLSPQDQPGGNGQGPRVHSRSYG